MSVAMMNEVFEWLLSGVDDERMRGWYGKRGKLPVHVPIPPAEGESFHTSLLAPFGGELSGRRRT